jgi:hypothetical protein
MPTVGSGAINRGVMAHTMSGSYLKFNRVMWYFSLRKIGEKSSFSVAPECVVMDMKFATTELKWATRVKVSQ